MTALTIPSVALDSYLPGLFKAQRCLLKSTGKEQFVECICFLDLNEIPSGDAKTVIKIQLQLY